MPKAKKRKDTGFEASQTKSVFLYGHPNKEKASIIASIQKLFTRLVNNNIQGINNCEWMHVQLIKNDKKDPQVRAYEKSIRPKGVNSAFCQAAFDTAFTHLSNRLNTIKDDMYREHDDVFTSSKVLFGMALDHATKAEMIDAMLKISLEAKTKRKAKAAKEGKPEPEDKEDFYEKCAKTLSEMPDEEFAFRMEEINDSFAMLSLEYKVPVISKARIPLDSRLMKLEESNDIKAPYVIEVTNPTEKGKRITVPLDTSKHSLHKAKSCKMARAVTCSINKGVLRIGWSYTKTVAKPATLKVNGVDTGIADLFYLSDGKHFGSMREVLDFYHKEVEKSFGEFSSLRNKKRKIRHFLRKHKNLPDDVRRSLIKKMDKLNRMIQKANAPYRKKRHYYQMLDKEIKDAVLSYVSSLDKETITVLELLDIREFNKSRRVNGMFSCFARGKAQQKLMQTLNWKGFDFVEVVPDYTSQVCPECSNLDKANRNGKSFLCTCCGYKGDADHTAGINIKARYLDKNLSKICEDNKYNHKVLQSKLSGYYSRKNELYKQQHPEKFVKKQNSEEQAASAT